MGSRLKGDRFEAVYASAQRWVESALRSDGSIFSADQTIWTTENLNELRLHFLEQPDVKGTGFRDKLRVQLQGCSAAAYQLMAEALYVHFLITDSIRRETKAARVNEVLGWSPSPFQIPKESVDGLAGGILGTGAAFGEFRPYYIGFILEFVEHWKTLGSSEQGRLLADPWEFKQLLMGVPLTSALLMNRTNTPTQQRLALLHLLFPDTFEAIISSEHKSRMSEAFAHFVDDRTQDIDRKLQQIRPHLEEQYGDQHWLFYHDAIKLQWDPQPPNPWDVFVTKAKEWADSGLMGEQENDYKRLIGERLSSAREAVLAGAENWRELVKRGLTGNLVFRITRSRFNRWMDNSQDRALKALRTLWQDGNSSLDTRFEGFNALLPKEDVNGVQGTGITGAGSRARLISVLLMGLDRDEYPPYLMTLFYQAYDQTNYPFPSSDDSEIVQYQHALGFLDRFMQEAESRGLEIEHHLEAQSLVWMVVNEGAPEEKEEGEDVETEDEEHGGKSLEQLADQLCLPPGFLRNITQLLEEKKQVIFQGPPGTGKTFVARALASHLTGGASDHVTLVQFHPSYAYEDFVQGFRPKADGQGFELRGGPLLKIADMASEHDNETYVLIIDEINRGNLGKVFGELYFLLEYRDSGIHLQYSEREFSLPQNLYIIGTMNTADRSIALVDLALRRRFYFKDFHPDEEPIKDVLRTWLSGRQPEMAWVADLVRTANDKMADDRHAAIGPSYFMRDALDVEAVRRIWEHSVLPYIEERFFGDRDRLNGFQLSKLMPDRFPDNSNTTAGMANDGSTDDSDSSTAELGPEGIQ